MPPGDTGLFVGRAEPLAQLRSAQDRLRDGGGSFWLISGPVGVGKSTLLERFSESARRSGAQVLESQIARDSAVSSLPFEELFHLGETSLGPAPIPFPAGPLLISEGDREGLVTKWLSTGVRTGACLLLTRDRHLLVRSEGNLPRPPLKTLVLNRSEGADHVSPANLDALGQRLEEHLRSAPGSTILLTDVEYLIVQNSFLAVLRLLQFLRETAESTGGRVVISLNPRSLDVRERALLESEGKVLAETSLVVPASSQVPETRSSGPLLLRYLTELEGMCRSQPVVLVLDDLHWMGPQSALALRFLVRNTRGLPVLIVGAMRTEYLEGGHAGGAPVNEALDLLAREGLLHRLPLAGLEPSARFEMVEALLGGSWSSTAEDRRGLAELLDPTHGNPLWIRELVDNLREHGWLVERYGKWILSRPATDTHQLPAALSLHRLVSQRLLRLTREERDLLETAALVGPSFSLDSVTGALGITAEHGRSVLEEMAEPKHLIVRAGPAHDRWRFTHPFLREKVLEEVPAARTRELSSRLAEWWVRTHPEEVEQIAHFYQSAGTPVLALDWISKALERAVRNQHGEPMARYAQWLMGWLGSLPSSMPARVEEVLRLAEGLRAQGLTLDAERLLRDLDRCHPPSPTDLPVLLALADLLLEEQRKEEMEEVLGRLDQGLSEKPDAAPRGVRAAVQILRAEGLARSGQIEPAQVAAQHALELLGEGGDPAGRARALEILGRISLKREDLRTAARDFAEGAEIARKTNRGDQLVLHLEGLGQVEWRRGNLPGALRYLEEAVAASRARGDMLGHAALLLGLARVLEDSGRQGEAESTALEALRISEQFDYLWSSGRALLFLGELAIERGRWPQARDHLALAVSRFALLGDARSKEEALLLGLRVRGEMGDPVGALRGLEELGGEGPLRAKVQARLRELTGDLPGAIEDLERAWEESGALPALERAGLRREMARLERVRGNSERALEHDSGARELAIAPREASP